jgi:hypothetical protein
MQRKTAWDRIVWLVVKESGFGEGGGITGTNLREELFGLPAELFQVGAIRKATGRGGRSASAEHDDSPGWKLPAARVTGGRRLVW